MTQLVINVGAAPNDGTGDPIRTSFQKVNTNFSELFDRVQTSPPSTLKGSPGDLAGMIAYSPTYFYYCFANYTNGINNIWASIDQTGNVIAEALQDGNSSITFDTPSGPVIITINNVANVAVFDETGATFSNVSADSISAQTVTATSISTGNMTSSGNITSSANISASGITATGNISATYFYGNGAYLTGISGGGGGGGGSYIYNGLSNVSIASSNGPVNIDIGAVSGLAQFDASGLTVQGNISANILSGNITTATQPNITSVGTLTSLDVTGNIASGNLSGTNIVGTLETSAQPNITSVGTLTALTVTGNISGGNLSGTKVTGQLTTAAQPNITSVGTLTSLDVTGNITGGNLSGTKVTGQLTTAAQPNITSVGTLTSLDVTGNITGGNLSGTNITGTLATSAQPNITSVGTLNALTVTGDISANNATLTNDLSAGGNVSANNLTTSNDITATGNVQATYFIGDGSLLSNIPDAYGNANVASYLPTYTGSLNPANLTTSLITAGTISTAANATLHVTSNAQFQQNVTVNGTISANLSGHVTGTFAGTSTGTHNGLVYSFDIRDMSWDFGFIDTNFYTNPIQYLLNQTGNIDMGTFLAPSSLDIDTGTY